MYSGSIGHIRYMKLSSGVSIQLAKHLVFSLQTLGKHWMLLLWEIPGLVQEVHPSSEDWERWAGEVQEESWGLNGVWAVGMERKGGSRDKRWNSQVSAPSWEGDTRDKAGSCAWIVWVWPWTCWFTVSSMRLRRESSRRLEMWVWTLGERKGLR